MAKIKINCVFCIFSHSIQTKRGCQRRMLTILSTVNTVQTTKGKSSNNFNRCYLVLFVHLAIEDREHASLKK